MNEPTNFWLLGKHANHRTSPQHNFTSVCHFGRHFFSTRVLRFAIIKRDIELKVLLFVSGKLNLSVATWASGLAHLVISNPKKQCWLHFVGRDKYWQFFSWPESTRVDRARIEKGSKSFVFNAFLLSLDCSGSSWLVPNRSRLPLLLLLIHRPNHAFPHWKPKKHRLYIILRDQILLIIEA